MPSRITVSGGERMWEDVKEAVDSQSEVAEASGDNAGVRAHLGTSGSGWLLQRTGSVPEHPAEAYDRAVEGEPHWLLPGAEIRPPEWRSREVPDFTVLSGGKTVYVETRWPPSRIVLSPTAHCLACCCQLTRSC